MCEKLINYVDVLCFFFLLFFYVVSFSRRPITTTIRRRNHRNISRASKYDDYHSCRNYYYMTCRGQNEISIRDFVRKLYTFRNGRNEFRHDKTTRDRWFTVRFSQRKSFDVRSHYVNAYTLDCINEIHFISPWPVVGVFL